MTHLDFATVPIADSSGGDRYGYLFSFGAYSSTHVAVLASSVEDALEAAVEWLDDNAPGLLSTVGEDDYKRAAEDLGLVWADTVTDERATARIIERAEADMTMVSWTTLRHGNCVPSWEWTFRGLNATETAIIRARSEKS